MVSGVIESETQFQLQAAVQGDWKFFGSRFDLTAAGFFIKVDTDDVQFGLMCDSNLALTSRPSDRLFFHDDLYVAIQGFGFDAAMTKDWVNPLGIPGVTLSRCDLSLELSWAIVPVAIGVAGGMFIDGVGGNASVWISETQQMVYGQLDNFNLQHIINALLSDVGVHSPPHLVEVITNIGFKDVKLYLNPSGTPVVFFGTTYPAGFMFAIDELNLWNIIRGSAQVAISESSLLLNATLQPINLLDGMIVISGAESAKDPAVLYLYLSPSSLESTAVNISGGVTFLGAHVGAEVILNDAAIKLYLDMKIFGDLFEFLLDCESTGPTYAPVDFSFNTTIANKLQDYIATEVPKRLQQAKTDTDSKFQAAEADLTAKKAKVDDLQNQIDQIDAEDKAKLSDAESKLASAQGAVEGAQHHVDELQDKIDDLKHKISSLKWYEKWKAVGYGTEIAGLEVAKVTADGVLDVAKLALEAAEKIVDHLDVVDPRIIALRTAKGIADAALDAAKALVGASEKVFNALDNAVTQIAIWQGKIFNIEYFELSGSLKAVASGDLAELKIIGKFLDHNVNIHVEVSIKDIESYVGNVWHEILKIL